SADDSTTRSDFFDANLTRPIPNGTLAGGFTNHFVLAGASADEIDPNAKASYTNEFVAGTATGKPPPANPPPPINDSHHRRRSGRHPAVSDGGVRSGAAWHRQRRVHPDQPDLLDACRCFGGVSGREVRQSGPQVPRG